MNKPQISERPLVALFGSESAYRVLMYLENYDKGYASEIARTFDISLNQAQNQLKKFEEIGLLTSRNEGTTRMYYFKQSPITDALRTFLQSMLEILPRTTIETYFRQRRRPRRLRRVHPPGANHAHQEGFASPTLEHPSRSLRRLRKRSLLPGNGRVISSRIGSSRERPARRQTPMPPPTWAREGLHRRAPSPV